MERRLDERNTRIVDCRRCPRLVAWREQVGREKRRAFEDWEYWARPVPDFGDPDATRLILGLAPAAHGANRTGLMFHGDRSGDWLYRALHKAGVAKLPRADSAADGQELYGVLITAAVHCAPPGNKPLPEELTNCRTYLEELIRSRQWESVLCLGSIAWNSALLVLGERRLPFTHLASTRTESGTLAVASFHPSQQNTFTGKLTEPMLDEAVRAFLAF